MFRALIIAIALLMTPATGLFSQKIVPAKSAIALSQRMRDALQKQVAREQYSANLYLSFASYFADTGLDGCEKFFRAQAAEEFEHAMIFYNHMLDRGMKFNLSTVEASVIMPTTIADAFDKLLANEREVTRSIYNLTVLALEEKDYTSEAFLHPFLLMQVEEEKNAEDYVGILSLGPTDPAVILNLDERLAELCEKEKK